MPTDLPFYTRYADGFRIDGWTVRPRSNELVRPGETLHVEPKPMHVLTLLAEHAGDTVTRDQLLEAVWPDVFVTENALSRCISQLRKLFDDDARAPRVIETIPTVGYRLVAPVHALGDGVALPSVAADLALSVPGDPVTPAGDMKTYDAPAPVHTDRAFILRRSAAWALLAVALLALGTVAWMNRTGPIPEPTTRPLTSVPGLEISPALSPDGSRVLYTHAEASDGDLYVEVVGAGTPLQLTNGPGNDRSATWAPDGRSVAFVRCEENACRLYTVPALGGEAQRLDDVPTAPWGLAYTPDGTRLVFVSRPAPNQPFHLGVLDLDTRERRPLTSPPATSYGDFDPVLSPDGTTLTFRRRTGAGGEDLYRLAFGDKEAQPERLTHDRRGMAGHSWSTDGREVIFSSNRTGMYELWRIRATGGTPERVRGLLSRDAGSPAVGVGQLVFEEWAFEINLWTAAAGSAEARPLVTSTWWDKHPHLAHDGRLAFISNRGGPPEVWLADADGASPSRLTEFDGASVEAPRWAPDGQRLAFQVRPDVQADVYVLDAEGGTPRALTPETSDEVWPRWSRDGARLYFGSNRDGSWQLWAMPTAGGEATQITEAGGIVGEESADGREVLYAKFGEAGLWARPVGGGPERLVTEALAPGAAASWAVTNAGVFIPGSEPATLLRLDPATGRADTLDAPRGQLMPGEPGLTVSDDGQRLVFAQVDRVESDLMLVTPFE